MDYSHANQYLFITNPFTYTIAWTDAVINVLVQPLITSGGFALMLLLNKIIPWFCANITLSNRKLSTQGPLALSHYSVPGINLTNASISYKSSRLLN